MRHDGNKQTLNPSVLLGHPAQIPPAGCAADGPRGQTCWGDAARPSVPSIQLGSGHNAGRLRSAHGPRGARKAPSVAERPQRADSAGSRDALSRACRFCEGWGRAVRGRLLTGASVGVRGPLKARFYRPDLLPGKNAARSVGLPGAGRVALWVPCVHGPLCGTRSAFRGKSADPEGWRPGQARGPAGGLWCRNVALSAGEDARVLGPQWGPGCPGQWPPGSGPSLVSQSRPLRRLLSVG